MRLLNDRSRFACRRSAADRFTPGAPRTGLNRPSNASSPSTTAVSSCRHGFFRCADKTAAASAKSKGQLALFYKATVGPDGYLSTRCEFSVHWSSRLLVWCGFGGATLMSWESTGDD